MIQVTKRFFQDDKGNYVIAQWPNLPLYMIGVSALLSRAGFGQDITRLFQLTTFGSIFLWAYLEITQGDAPFRRVLGAAAMIWLLGTTNLGY